MTGTHIVHNTRSSGASDEEFLIDIRSIFLMFWRRKYIIFSVVFIGLLSVIGILSYIKPHYTARALVLVESNATSFQIPKELQVLVGNYARADSSVISNEIEIIRSRNMAQKVIDRLDLLNNAGSDLTGAIEAGQKDSFKALKLNGAQGTNMPPEIIEEHTNIVVTNFLNNLSVRAIPGSYAIQIQYTSPSPRQAALVANTIADVYIEERLAMKFKAGKKLTDWLDSRLNELREQVRKSEIAVADYQAQNNLTEGIRSIITAEQISQLNSQLISAKAKKAEAQVRLDQVRKIAETGETLETSSDVMEESFISRLRSQESDLLIKLSDLSNRYGEKHPSIIKVREELKELRGKIKSEMGRVAQSFENEVLVASARVKALEDGLNELKEVRNSENEKMVRMNELMREAKSNQLIFDTFLQTYKRSDEQEQLQEAEARIISYAAIPRRPSYPDKLLFLSLGITFSLFLGIFISFLLEKLDNTFRSPNQLEKATQYPCYALIPAMDNMNQKQLVRYVLDQPSSTVAEAVRTLRTVLNLRATGAEGKKPKVITITSSFPGEGKTTLSCWLGHLAAKSGDKVILIDCDMRRPNVHRSLDKNNDISIVEYLSGKNTLDEVVHKDETSGLHTIYAKSVPNSALDLVSSDKMKNLVEALSQEYDLVILDSPACLAVSDARLLARYSDLTVYSVAWDRTPREVVMGGVKQFTDMGYDNIAFTLTNVDIKRHVRYGYGDVVYYYGMYDEGQKKA